MQTFLSDILHVISQSLLAPDIIVLIALIAYAIVSLGGILVEYLTEHRHYKVAMPQFLAAISAASVDELPSVIDQSGLLRRQKDALRTVFEYRDLPGDALIALVRRLMHQEEAFYNRITGRNNIAAKIAPMFGLMGTLIPLGPGIQALGKADTSALSSSLLVAFDTTVAGLVVAAVCLVIGRIRRSWYDNYLSALDSSFATMVQKIEDLNASFSGFNAAGAPQTASAFEPFDYGERYAAERAQVKMVYQAAVEAEAQRLFAQAEEERARKASSNLPVAELVEEPANYSSNVAATAKDAIAASAMGSAGINTSHSSQADWIAEDLGVRDLKTRDLEARNLEARDLEARDLEAREVFSHDYLDYDDFFELEQGYKHTNAYAGSHARPPAAETRVFPSNANRANSSSSRD